MPLREEGTWKEFAISSADSTVVIPKQIDDYTAAQLYINPVTTWIICTEILDLKYTDILLVNACGSAIVHLLAQLSNVFGNTLIAVTRNGKYKKELLQNGASYVIDRSKDSLYQLVMEITGGRNVSAAVDSIGGTDRNELAFCLQYEGKFLTIGLLSGIPLD
ncbi:Zinc-binding dehydrogenase [Gracilibacillus ureilyticus]|uniref:Zinc-binding dehydrogenase n=1 Tax=Gracilibacillus ureilyticus TaxID=531814 RepID=A0A1H9T7A2_9BACI|nr:Zinc-binding dehydrogenase [Gracilibacillus ureilyticus]